MTRIYHGWKELPDFADTGSFVTWGVFDGVHIGHQAIIETLVGRAEEKEIPSVILTFDPHPREILGGSPPSFIYSLDRRVRYVKMMEPDGIGVVPFSESFSKLSPSEFYQLFLRESLNASGVVLGEGARFGKDRAGDLQRLCELGEPEGLEVISCSYTTVDGERVSSSRLREVISSGDLETARRMLGRPVEATGTVVRGEGRGREIGFPTANLDVEHDVYPPRGIYGGIVELEDTTYPAVASIGIRPTFEGNEREVVEVHLLDFSGDLYDRRITFAFRCFLREEEEYDSVDELVRQIEQDIEMCRQHPTYPEEN